MNRRAIRRFDVAIELPRQVVEVYAKTEDDAEAKAWQMIGLAGLRHFGTVEVTTEAEVASS